MNLELVKQPPMFALILLGALTGLLSGIFGIGGGVLIVPLLVLLLGFPQKLAAGTSVVAILPAAVSGGISYAIQGNVDWASAIALAVGMVGGVQLGSYLLVKINTQALRVIFLCFLAVVIVSLWFVVPTRDSAIDLSVLTVILLVLTGFVVGILSGLLGIGGGIVVVPMLMFFYGASDLMAKGTSLMMMIPGSISGTLANLKRGTVHLRSAITLGVMAALSSPVGSFLATLISPFWSNVAFSLFLTFILIQMAVKMVRDRAK